ncbi:phage portal protein [Methylobacterium radiotolerans]|uniref:phage portal protein n=1 Tax=Methylobacterium radiotolerans TaxID=31998 RepID=UPI001AEF2067|nr:phage portal protein [Methylobacterium radiotolerans]
MAGKKKQRKMEAVAARGPATAMFAPGLGYEASRMSRRLAGWTAERTTINALQARGGAVLRARARQLVRDNPYASAAAENFVAAAVGDGITPSPTLADKALKTALKDAWLRWTDECDADGLTDFYGLQALAARSLFVAGEVFIRFRPRRPEDGLSVPLQLQLIESEQLPLSYGAVTAENGNEIRHGIEFNAIGRRVAYHFLKRRPGEAEVSGNLDGLERTVVPASEVLHLYRPLEAGQIRGQSQLTPGMVRLYLIDSYDDAELDRKRTAAMFSGFVTKSARNDPPPIPLGTDNPIADQFGVGTFGFLDAGPRPVNDIETALADLEPGTMQVLNDGESVTFSEPADVGGSYEAFMYRNLLAIAAACGVPYSALTEDPSKGNFSSQRGIELQHKRRVGQFQHQCLVFQMCRPVWARWVETAALAGSVSGLGPTRFARERVALSTVKWQPPKWDWVDPLKDRKADELDMLMGVTSRADVIEARGEDPEEVDARRAEDKDRAERLGLPPMAGTVEEPAAAPIGDAAAA